MPTRTDASLRALHFYGPRARPVRVRSAAAARIAGVLLLLAAGCAGNSSVERGLDRAGGGISYAFDGARTESRTFAVALDGIVDVDVQTFGGDVVLRSGHGPAGTASIEATVAARHGGNRTKEADAALGTVELTAQLRRGGDVPTLEVRATTTSAEPWLLRTDIDVTLPEMRRVRVHTRSGKVHVYENRGGVLVETTDGDIRVLTPWAITEDVTLVTKGKDIVFRAYTGTCGTVDIDCVNGEVLSRVEAGDWRIVDSRNDHDTLHATLGTCNNTLRMRNVDAKVIFSVVKKPMEYGTFFVSP
ncbi:MAG: hypothetical protein U0625_02100 [Phycisphaerales bacterium]